MSRSEFRWNKRRKHYSYLHKKKGRLITNILISSKGHVVKHKKGREKIIMNNVRLSHHPDANIDGVFYVIPKNYTDDIDSFGRKVYRWEWDRNDKRKIKRIKKSK